MNLARNSRQRGMFSKKVARPLFQHMQNRRPKLGRKKEGGGGGGQVGETHVCTYATHKT